MPLNKLLSSIRRSSSRRGANRPRFAVFADSRKPINLALQGGGAHGAFTWGVLHEILSDDRIAIGAISGTSAGAVNAVMLADGLASGGPQEAQRRLADFWRAASFDGSLPELQRGVLERLFSFVSRRNSPAPWLGTIGVLSPYEVNPLNLNPLNDVIERFVDFERIRNGERELFVTATNVRTGEPRVFTRSEMTAEAVMASACLPLLFRAIEIDGEAYWDGGYSGNPGLLPFLISGSAEDVLLVQINPLRRRKLPRTAREIAARIDEITFNAPLLTELRALELVGDPSRLRLHRIVTDGPGDALEFRSRLNTDYDYFEKLRRRGERAARRFLELHFDDIGRRSTLDASLAPRAEVA